MSKFTPASKKNPVTTGGFTVKTDVVKEDSGYIYIPNSIKNDQNLNIRMLPSFDGAEEELPLNPEATASDSLGDTLGACFVKAELMNMYRNNTLQIFLSSILPEDKQGNEVPIKGQTPIMRFCKRLGYKMYEQTILHNHGYSADVPLHWFSWNQDKLFNKPRVCWFVGAYADNIGGKIAAGSGNKPKMQGPGIFAIPGSAEEHFFAQITARQDDDEDLSLENNNFGDFCSLDAGITMKIKKAVTNGKTTYSILGGKKAALKKEEVKKIYKPLSEVLKLQYIEDCIEFLKSNFDAVSLDYAFNGSYDQWIKKYLPEEYVGASEDVTEAISIDELRAMKDKSTSAPKSNKKTAPDKSAEEGTNKMANILAGDFD